MKWIGRRKRPGKSAEDDVAAEIDAHLTARTEDLMERGVPEP